MRRIEQTKHPRLFLDVETRSPVNIKEGSEKYSRNCELICLSYGYTKDTVKTWVGDGATPFPEDLKEEIYTNGFIAHNATFELRIFNNSLLPSLGLPPVDPLKVLCTMCMCAYHKISESLGEAAKVLKLKTQKNETGEGLIARFCALDKNTYNALLSNKAALAEYKYAPELYEEYLETNAEIVSLIEEGDIFHPSNESGLRDMVTYCEDDVRTTIDLFNVLIERDKGMPIPSQELDRIKSFLSITQNGISIDEEYVNICYKEVENLIPRLKEKYLKDYGFSFTQRNLVLNHIKEFFGVEMPDATKDTKQVFRSFSEDEGFKNFMDEWDAAGKSSLAKYASIKKSMIEGKAYDVLKFNGAHTRRLSGKTIQPQNFPGGMNQINTLLIKGIIKLGLDNIKVPDTDKVFLLVSGLRGALTIPDGYIGIAADYASVEPRRLAAVVNQESLIELFKSKGDMYCDTAMGIYRRPINKKDNPKERETGKIFALGSGYQMGFITACLTNYSKKGRLFNEESVREIYGGAYDEAYVNMKEYLVKDREKYENRENGIEDESEEEEDDALEVSDIEQEYDVKVGLKAKRETIYGRLKKLNLDSLDFIDEFLGNKAGVKAYREKYNKITEGWYHSEKIFKMALLKPDVTLRMFDNVYVRYYSKGRSKTEKRLYLFIGEGDWLVYNRPILVMPKKDPHRETFRRSKIVYYSPKKSGKLYEFLHGGKIIENIIQWSCRLSTESAGFYLQKNGFRTELIVHDEIRALIPKEQRSPEIRKRFEDIMAEGDGTFLNVATPAEAEEYFVYSK